MLKKLSPKVLLPLICIILIGIFFVFRIFFIPSLVSVDGATFSTFVGKKNYYNLCKEKSKDFAILYRINSTDCGIVASPRVPTSSFEKNLTDAHKEVYGFFEALNEKSSSTVVILANFYVKNGDIFIDVYEDPYQDLPTTACIGNMSVKSFFGNEIQYICNRNEGYYRTNYVPSKITLKVSKDAKFLTKGTARYYDTFLLTTSEYLSIWPRITINSKDMIRGSYVTLNIINNEVVGLSESELGVPPRPSIIH